MVEIEMQLIGTLPPCFLISDYLWGKSANIDSDGNSGTPQDTNWTELTLTLRSHEEKRIDIDPVEDKPGVLVLKSTDEKLAHSVLNYLQAYGAVK